MPVPFVILVGLLSEIALFILVGDAIGVLPTLALILASMVAGVMILRSLGTRTVEKVRADLSAKRAPAKPLIDGAAKAVAAMLLILPGFITDVLAICLLVPGIREGLWRFATRNMRIVTYGEGTYGEGARYGEPENGREARPGRPPLVELDPEDYDARPHPDSPWRGTPQGGDGTQR